MSEYIYDVAFSFAGEQRTYVGEVAEYVREKGVPVFYDEFEQSKLWGKNLVEHLDLVYGKQARCVVMFISKEYKSKKWTRHEIRSALATAIERSEEYVLPVRFDNTELDGLHPTIAYIDANKYSSSELGDMIITKIEYLKSHSVEEIKQERAELISEIRAITEKEPYVEKEINPLLNKLYDSITLKPGVFGISIDLKKLFTNRS